MKYLVKRNTDKKSFEETVKNHGGHSKEIHPVLDWHIVEIKDKNFLKHSHVKQWEEDRGVKHAAIPNDPSFANQWHHAKIQTPQTWDVTQGQGITVSIIDTGVNQHLDLPALLPGYNFYDNNTNSADVWGHGTAVAGTVAANYNNNVGCTGVAGMAKIMPIRVCDTSGVGYWSAMASALTWAADNGAKVANLSWENIILSAGINAAADYFKSKGGLVVYAAGNSGSDPGFTPSNSSISVAASDENDNLCSFSSRGIYVDIAAPGQNIYTTTSDGGYNYWLGTSFSAPIVCGVIALMMAANPSAPNTVIETTLYSSADQPTNLGYKRINAWNAVQAIKTYVAPAPSPVPAPPPPPKKKRGH